MRVVHNQWDASRRYRVLVEEHTWAGIPTRYTVHVIDEVEHTVLRDDQEYHSDADAICEGWATVSLLLASKRSELQGAYVIGASEY